MKNREPWNFCETPKEKCTMNYCDENGCQNRKRNYVEGNDFIADVMAMLPSVDDAGVIAVSVASNIRPKLTAQEEAMFITGFQECVKYLSMQEKGN